MIPKVGRDPTDPKSYCPISLLNQDYKLFTALLIGRLNKIITAYVHQDQAGFIPGRDILDNVYRTLEVIHYCKAQKMESTLLLSLDVEKAFDRIEHGFILSLLQRMNFGRKFLTALQTIYESPSASVKVNGHISTNFKITRGTYQGCPFSPLLFVLLIEPLAEALRRAENFKGIQIGQKMHTLSLFADNMVLYVSEPKTSLITINEVLEAFCKVFGLNDNIDKSMIFPIQPSPTLECYIKWNLPFLWVTDHWRYLGVQISLDFTQFSQLNLEKVDGTVQATLKLWDKKMLSWFDLLQPWGSQNIYFCLEITSKLLQKWQKSLLDFIWQYSLD